MFCTLSADDNYVLLMIAVNFFSNTTNTPLTRYRAAPVCVYTPAVQFTLHAPVQIRRRTLIVYYNTNELDYINCFRARVYNIM